MKNTYRSKRILITGGTGTLGSALVNCLLESKVKEIMVYSRDEFKQSEMARKINDKRVTYYLGDVRDLERLKEACDGMHVVIHTAAFKRMDSTSHNAYELADVNIRGTHNVMIAAKKAEKIVFVSTDKAFNPSCVYGATKMIAESIALAANAVVWRFGNFIGSRGSVWEIFVEQKKQGVPFTITDPNATRFVMPVELACDLILSNGKKGRMHYPNNLKSVTVAEIADSIDPNHLRIITGLRDGEKIHESFNENYTSENK